MTAILKLMATKLGLKEEIEVLSKASEFERLLKIKMCGSNNISDSTKSIICLDLGAESTGVPFDLESGLKLAAVKKSVYANNKHTIKKVLNIEDVLSVNSLCVQLGCTSASKLANTLLENFKKSDIKNSDLDHPQFTCMAVYQACRVEKIKIAKSKFVTSSHLKMSQWNELENEWTNIVDNFIKETGISNKNKNYKKQQSVAEAICNNLDEKVKSVNEKVETPNVEELEDYEVWKKRILEKARMEIESENSPPINVVYIKDIKAGKDLPKIDRNKGLQLIFDK